MAKYSENYAIFSSVIGKFPNTRNYLEQSQFTQGKGIEVSAVKWTEVRCGVLQRSILGPLLFAIFIDDINDEVLCKVSKFADDIRIPSQVNAYNGIRSIYRTLDKLVG